MAVKKLIGKGVRIEWKDASDWNNFRIVGWGGDGWMELEGLQQDGISWVGGDFWTHEGGVETIELLGGE